MKKPFEYLALSCLLTIIIIITFYEVYSGYKIFVSGDSLSPIALREGVNKIITNNFNYPLWIPWIFSGMPSIHSFTNISDLYYPQYFFVFLNKIGLPWIWNFLLHLIFSGIGMYSLLRYLSCSKYASLFSSILFMISPYMVAMTVFGHGSQVMTASYIPFIILLLIRLHKEKKVYYFPVFSLLVGLQLQRGHIQIAYYTWMMIGLFIVLNNYHVIKSKTYDLVNLIKHNFLVLVSLFSGLLLSLNIYFPVVNYLSDSTRSSLSSSSGIDFATQWSFSIKESLTLFFPYLLGFGGKLYSGDMPFTDYPNYLGIIVFILAIIGLLKSNLCKEYKLFFLLVSFFSFFISLGHNFIIFYKIFYYCFPYFDKFRVPVYLLILVYFSVLIFSAFGLDHLIKITNNKYKVNKYLKYLSLSLGIVFSIYLFYPKIIINKTVSSVTLYKLINYDFIFILSLLILFIVMLFIFSKRKYPSKYFYLIVCLICFYDYLRIDHEIISASKHIPHSIVLKEKQYVDNYLSEDSTIEFLLEDTSKFRIFDILGPQNKWGAFHIENINGYHPAKIDNYNKLINKLNDKGYNLWPPNILKLLNVKYLIIPYENFNHPEFEKVLSTEMFYFGSDKRYDGKKIPSYIYKFKNHYPRLFYTENINTVSNNDVYDLVTNELFDPAKNSYITEDELISFNFDKNSKVEIISWSPNEIIFKTNTTSKQFLVISEIFYSNGWKISDGIDNYKIYNVNGVLRGMVVPEGIHKFTMTFSPFDVKWGRYISLLMFISLIIIFIYYFSKTKNVKDV